MLRNTIEQWHAKGASAIVLDPRTGGILAMAVERGYDANLLPDRARGPAAQPDRHGHVRAGLDVQARHGQRGALGGPRHAVDGLHAAVLDPRRRPDHPRRASARHRAADRRPDPLAVVERRDDHARREARPGAAQPVDQPLRLRPPDRDRLPRRDARDRAAARQVVGLDDRHASDRPRDRDHPGPDGRGLRDGRERRRLAPAAPRRPHRLA